MMNIISRDLYEILGVRKTADADELKRAYRKLARKHHPDRGGDPEVFGQIDRAYKVLSDASRRRQYDATVGLSMVPELFASAHALHVLELHFGGRPMDALPGANRVVSVDVTREMLQHGGQVTINLPAGMGIEREAIVCDIPPGTYYTQFLVIPGLGDPGEVREDVSIPGQPGTLFVRLRVA
jgi:DnaJ-class molecular chaperone